MNRKSFSGLLGLLLALGGRGLALFVQDLLRGAAVTPKIGSKLFDKLRSTMSRRFAS